MINQRVSELLEEFHKAYIARDQKAAEFPLMELQKIAHERGIFEIENEHLRKILTFVFVSLLDKYNNLPFSEENEDMINGFIWMAESPHMIEFSQQFIATLVLALGNESEYEKWLEGG